MSESQPVSENMLPPPEMVDQIESESFHIIGNLTSLQQRVVIALARNPLLEVIHSDTEIAKECGTTVQYLWQLRRKPQFTQALGLLIRELARGTQDKAFRLLMKHAEKDPGSVKTWLEMGDTFVRRQRNENVNLNLSARHTRRGNIEDDIEAMLVSLGELGWSVERVQALGESLAAKYLQLRTEGAF